MQDEEGEEEKEKEPGNETENDPRLSVQGLDVLDSLDFYESDQGLGPPATGRSIIELAAELELETDESGEQAFVDEHKHTRSPTSDYRMSYSLQQEAENSSLEIFAPPFGIAALCGVTIAPRH